MKGMKARVEILKEQSAGERVVESQLNLASKVQALGEYWGIQAQHLGNQVEEWHDAALFCREQKRLCREQRHKIARILRALKGKISFEP